MNRKKKQSLKSEIKNSTKQKESDIFFSRRINIVESYYRQREHNGEKRIKNRIVLNYFLGSLVTILRPSRSTYIIFVGHHMLVCD